jgi:cell division septation protein DedD
LTVLASSFACLIIAIAASGCSSSETTQNNSSTSPSDSAYSQGRQTIPQKSSRSQRQSSSGNQQGFVTQEDTIEAEVVTRNHNANHMKLPSQRSSKKKYYSVQLGAFHILSNADRAKKIAQQRYKKPVYQFFDKPIKMYRVTLGNFPKINEALKFLKMIQQQHPKEYKDAWVAEMRR